MKKFATWILLAVLTLGIMLPMAAAVAEEVSTVWVKTGGKKLKMYSEMSTKSGVMVKIPNGKKIKIYDYFYGSKWAEASWNGYYGYVQMKYVSFKKPPKATKKPAPKPTPKPTAKHTTKPKATPESLEKFTQVDYLAQVTLAKADSHVNMRWQPSSDADVVGVYENGAVLQAMAQSDQWTQVHDTDTNRVGYIMTKFLTKTEEMVVGDEIEEQTDPELVVSPINAMDGLESLQAAVPDAYLLPVPEGAENVTYCWIDNEPVLAQMEFTLDGIDYVFRAAACESEAEEADIDGIYLPMHEESEEAGLHVLLDEEGVYAVAHYYSAENKTQYSLTGAAHADKGAALKALAAKVFPAA